MLLLVGCGKERPSTAVTNAAVVTNVNITDLSGRVSTYVLFTNGMYFGFQTNMLSVEIPGHYAAWIYYKQTSSAPYKMVHQFYGTNRYWLTDRDADGIPDSRVDYNEGPKRGSESIFMNGDWIDAKLLGTNATAIIDGKQTRLQFADGKWSIRNE